MIVAKMRFLQRLELYKHEKPFQLFVNLPAETQDKRQSNLVFEEVSVNINDIRDRDTPPTLDDNGFVIKRFSSMVEYNDMNRREVVESIYYREMEALLEAEDDSIYRVFFFDWRVRSTGKDANHERLDLNDSTKFILPAMSVHVDQSPKGVVHRILLQLGEEAAELLQGRVRIINIWKPLLHTVDDYHLALCDGSTVSEDDLVPSDNIRQAFQGESYQVHFNKSQKWYYLSNHHPDEALMFKIFDSKPTVNAKGCPHGAFKMPNPPANAKGRRSVEVRALVFSPIVD